MARGPRIDWSHVDFSRPAAEIAAECRCSIPAVYAARRRMEAKGEGQDGGAGEQPRRKERPAKAEAAASTGSSLNHGRIIKALEAIVKDGSHDGFIYDFLLAYGFAGSTVKLLRLGDRQRNKATVAGDIAVERKIYFRAVAGGADLQKAAEEICAMEVVAKNQIRFVLVTDYQEVVGIDLKVGDQTYFDFQEFPASYEFFLPLTGLYEKAVAYSAHPADVKACEKMARLYDGIRASNHYEGRDDLHALNVFLTRLLYCFFAEDSKIFPSPDMMTSAVMSNTRKDGADVGEFFRKLFAVLDMPEDAPERVALPESFRRFPYVNGDLFSEEIRIPKFTAKTRRLLIDCGQMAWRSVNPSIFGAMFQAVMEPDVNDNEFLIHVLTKF